MEGLDLGALFLQFLLLWFLAIGGPSTIFPDIHRYVVEAHHLLTGEQFAEIYTVAQVAPGPNAMYGTPMMWAWLYLKTVSTILGNTWSALAEFRSTRQRDA